MAVKEHFKENKAMYVAGALLSVLFGGGGGATFTTYVDNSIERHLNAGPHPAAEKQIIQVDTKLNTLLRISLAEEIRKVMRWQCGSPGDVSRDNELERLQEEYMEVNDGRRYPRLNC